jgi:hypothetical protein
MEYNFENIDFVKYTDLFKDEKYFEFVDGLLNELGLTSKNHKDVVDVVLAFKSLLKDIDVNLKFELAVKEYFKVYHKNNVLECFKIHNDLESNLRNNRSIVMNNFIDFLKSISSNRLGVAMHDSLKHKVSICDIYGFFEGNCVFYFAQKKGKSWGKLKYLTGYRSNVLPRLLDLFSANSNVKILKVSVKGVETKMFNIPDFKEFEF